MTSNPATPSSWGIQLSKLWMMSGQAFPIGAKEIALEVTKQRFSDPVSKVTDHGVAGVDGMLSKRAQKGDWCISYDGAVPLPGRINFTVAHELGHYLLHRNTRDEFVCAQSQMLDYTSAPSRRLEAEANTFASFLLMPANDFRDQVDGEPITIALLGHCAERYGTTFTATALKWLELTDEVAMLVVARDEFVCWSYPSGPGRRQNIYLPPGTPVPQHSLDWLSCADHKHSQNSMRRVSAGVWHHTLDAEEAIIVSDRYEQMIFLVRFPSAGMAEHDDELTEDSATFLTERAQGLNWKK